MKKKNKVEKSFICLAVILLFGMVCVATYYVAIFFDKPCDSTVATTSLTTIIGGLLSYFLYQFGLKNSRNKYGIDSDGQPFAMKVEYDDVDDNEDIENNADDSETAEG